MSGVMMWLCVLAGTAILGAAVWAGMKFYGHWAMQRDEEERQRLQEEWKRRAAERKKAQGAAPATEEEETGENPPLY